MLKLAAPLLASLLVMGCSGIGSTIRPLGGVVGQATYASCSEGAERSPAVGFRVEARTRERGGLLQRFRWRVGQPVAETITDSLGRFVLAFPPGTYYVLGHQYTSSRRPGYDPAFRLYPGLSNDDAVGAVETVSVQRGQPVQQDLRLLVVCER